jgi:replicative DNA helicase
VLGAISSLGKTTFVSQIADQMAKEGEKILFFSLEQSRFELVAKSLSRETWKTKTPKTALQIMQMETPSEELIQAIESYEKFADNITTIEGNFGMNVFKVREIIETYIKTNRTKPVVVIDYLQILTPTNDRLTDKAQVDFNVSELKRISRDNNITIFVICSFNRENYNATVDFRSFKESGAIEYGADVVLGLQLSVLNNLPNNLAEQREEINKAKSSSPREVELVCLKNRNGKPYFKCSYRFHSAYNCFIEEGVVE